MISDYMYQAYESQHHIMVVEWFMVFCTASESQEVEDVQGWCFAKMFSHSLWIPECLIICVLKRRWLYIQAYNPSVKVRNHTASPEHR